MASHAQDDGFHEIQLNGKQLVFVFMATTVVLVVTFLCGVLVGRGVRAERTDTAQVTAPPAVEQLKDSIDSGKPPTIQQSEDPTKAPPPAPAEGGTSGHEAASLADSTAATVAGAVAAGAIAAKAASKTESRPSPEGKPAAGVPEKKSEPVATNSAREAAPKPDVVTSRLEATSPKAPAREPAVKPGAKEPSPAAAAPAAKPPAAAPAAKSPAAAPGAVPAPDEPKQGWVVQVAAVKTRGEADGIARRLTSKGYAAFVLSNSANVFRVRVGGYKNKRDAESVAARLRQEERVSPWVTR